ncbi:lysozyme inhibitor LprI family protein [Brenneria corticis]|uniref:Lysozyme inhibitor LprI N-terminal domain-containing protein n=1 Tax=Brenneria corticis TaxID=2173106 RepID=A0A2U1TL79_9GAMM|nr:hypothetical protein [Brenneria sp. CFCC 11842]PWC10119.1 hypothetical protein DDT56_22495 [Brenneria sp. CFCC 11842]
MALNKLKKSSIFFTAIFLSTTVFADEQNQLFGIWQVTEASINTESQRTLNYQYNDDRLVGREITIAPESISANFPGCVHCPLPDFKSEPMTLDTWVAKTEGDTDGANAKSYNLNSPGNEKVTVFTTRCAAGNFSSGGDASGNALLALSQHKIRLNWSDGIILTLQPVDAKTAPAPSFDCAKASNETEKAICGDRELASYDVSVKRSFDFFRQQAGEVGNSGLQQQITQEQKSWLRERNVCGKDKACLKTAMQNRLEALAHIMDGQ